MRKTELLTFILLVSLSAFGCGETTASLTANKPAAASTFENATTDEASLVVQDQRNAGASFNSSAIASKPISVGQAVKQVIDDTSLSQARTAFTETSPTARRIIRNADLSLESQSPEETQRRITSIAEANGGFVVESQPTSSDTRATKRDIVTMSVRVPSQKFADTLDQIRSASEKVIFETVKGDDVTEEFIDIEARLKAKKALELQFTEIMKRAVSINEALMVQSQLAEVRGEIEKIEGRKRFLENQSSLSTIKIKLQTPEAVFSTSSKGFGARLSQSFGVGLDFALDFVLGLLTFFVAIAPFAVFIGLPIMLIVRYFWKRRSRSRTIIELAKEELNAA
ncbi:MAG: DUF4349 domain-containing protein [Chloracidobacterium sp.]|nr:DUF4349 domain-containing protein [Chloracidobacterium sp.]